LSKKKEKEKQQKRGRNRIMLTLWFNTTGKKGEKRDFQKGKRRERTGVGEIKNRSLIQFFENTSRESAARGVTDRVIGGRSITKETGNEN